MDQLGWIVAILLLLGFGKSGLFTASASLDLQNQKPTPDGIPFMTTQDQLDDNTANAPPPWGPSNACASGPMPVTFNTNPVSTMTGAALPTIAPKTRIQFYQ